MSQTFAIVADKNDVSKQSRSLVSVDPARGAAITPPVPEGQHPRYSPSGLPAIPERGGATQNWNRVDWQKLWLATQRAPWRSLALVPAGAVAEDFTLEIAVSLVRTGMMHLGVPIRIADATQVPLAHLMQFKNEVESVIHTGDLVLLALGPIHSNPTTISLAQSCDSALLCVPLGHVSMNEAKKTIKEIGSRHFIGSVTFRV